MSQTSVFGAQLEGSPWPCTLLALGTRDQRARVVLGEAEAEQHRRGLGEQGEG